MVPQLEATRIERQQLAGGNTNGTYVPEFPIDNLVAKYDRDPDGEATKPKGLSLDELTESLKENGVLSPLIISKMFRILGGNRRARAARKAGLKVVPVFIREDIDTDEKELAAVLAMDTQEKRDPASTAKLISDFAKEHDCTISQAAEKFGVSASVASRLKAFDALPADLKQRIHDKQLPFQASPELKRAKPEALEFFSGMGPKDRYTLAQVKALLKPKKKSRGMFIVIRWGCFSWTLPIDAKPEDLECACREVVKIAVKIFALGYTMEDLPKALLAQGNLPPK
ncbi:ParB/RepB/Spo0J family partition protein [Limnoglobus roseus]|uniref:Chromosome partitioning protein ParB n=1 Tax=Limnoglobus roseus TaxID=2598579 RepID=A0A5C1AJC5_9BACT|nr:ParB/RepB/Spo0J family partition protein [Limnoglobus roseus]QEL19291.1 chromosome partitioning protein ParB [Limnoglobus roseus]